MSKEKNVNLQKKQFGTLEKDAKIKAFINSYELYRKEKTKSYNVKNEKSDLKKQLQQWQNNNKKTS